MDMHTRDTIICVAICISVAVGCWATSSGWPMLGLLLVAAILM